MGHEASRSIGWLRAGLVMAAVALAATACQERPEASATRENAGSGPAASGSAPRATSDAPGATAASGSRTPPTGITPPSNVVPQKGRMPSTSLPGKVTTGQGGPGTVTVALTSPIALAGNVATPVACTISGRLYEATIASATIAGQSLGVDVKASPYNGPGSYLAITKVTLTLNGTTTTLGPLPLPTTITETGGTVTVSGATSSGVTIAGSVAWACSA